MVLNEGHGKRRHRNTETTFDDCPRVVAYLCTKQVRESNVAEQFKSRSGLLSPAKYSSQRSLGEDGMREFLGE